MEGIRVERLKQQYKELASEMTNIKNDLTIKNNHRTVIHGCNPQSVGRTF